MGAGEPLHDEVVRLWQNTSGRKYVTATGRLKQFSFAVTSKAVRSDQEAWEKPSPGVPIMVLDSKGNKTDVGVEGEIGILRVEVSNPDSFFGLYGGSIQGSLEPVRKTTGFPQPDSTHKMFYLTGDRGMRDEDRCIWFVGREDDVINSVGYRIRPFEVESTIKLHPAVVESAAVASLDDTCGEVVKAFVVLVDENKSSVGPKLTKELQEFCKEKGRTLQISAENSIREPGVSPQDDQWQDQEE